MSSILRDLFLEKRHIIAIDPILQNRETPMKSIPDSNPPLVSILMPAFNGEKHIQEAIQSVLNQTYPYFELLILNDGSIDRTQSILDSFSDPRIKRMQHLQNLGLVATRNDLVAAAQGKYIALLDCDDIALPNRIAAQVDFLEKETADIIGSDHFTLNESNGKIKRSKQRHSDADIRAMISVCSPLCNPSVMGHATIFKAHPYRVGTDVVEDYTLWQELALSGTRFANLKDSLIYYRIHDQQSSHNKIERNQQIFFKQQKSYLIGLGIDPTLTPRAMPWLERLAKGPKFLMQLNKRIRGISLSANYQIYARFQLRKNGLWTPITRLERLLIASYASLLGRL